VFSLLYMTRLQAIEIRPVLDAHRDATPLGRAFLLRQRGQFEAAVAVLSTGLRFAPKDFRMLFNRGYMLYKLARYEKALADFHACWAVCTASPLAAPKTTLFAASSNRGSEGGVTAQSSADAAAGVASKRAASDQQSSWRRMGCCVVKWNMALW
jgi:hypothetical protein